MPIAFDCACGKAFRVPDEHAGKRTKCPACGGALTVPAPPASAEDDAFRLLEAAEAPERPARAAPPPPPSNWSAPRRPVAAAPPPPPAAQAKTRPRPVRRPRDDRGGGGFQIVLSPAVAGGLASMAIAGVWIALALSNNRIPIYAPVLFVFGLVAVVRGFFGAPEE
jgi:hypothetical protein